MQATDVYDNFTSTVLRVERSEGIPPVIALTAPVASADQTITIDADKETVFVEGRVSDGSPIRLIAVDGVNASYAPDALNPEFSIKVEVKGKDRFVVHAEDQYGNSSDQVFALARKAPTPVTKPAEPVTASTPAPSTSSRTGTTWVIHIENSNYRNFPAVGGGDAAKMQKAFANYSVSRTINKKNLTKEQFDRFFNIELRDLVRTNKVSTILVWYSGHGKSVGGKAYWVPVDARKDDIYSYFNYGSLKAQMQNYSESVDKTVVVSDAAGSDASFYELTR
ncbi:MAG: caspase family protein [Flavobacteriales bacterium]|nr:caspase family protein [Flavobacteriales bacterium]